MLSTLKQLLVKDQDDILEDRQEEEYIPKRPENPNFITGPAEIEKLLKNIEQNAQLCTITFADNTDEFSSSILDVKVKEKCIYLDALSPERGNLLLENSKHVKLSTYLKGIHLAFKLTISDIYSAQGLAYYKASYPERIFYPQRRKSLRIKLTVSNVPFSGRISKNDASVRGSVYDISRNGIGIQLNSANTRVMRGDMIKGCSILLEGYRMEFDLQVRFTKRSQHGAQPALIVGTIEKLSNESQKELARFLISLERKEIRKKKS